MEFTQKNIYGAGCSLFFMSLVMGCDLLLELLCARLPLLLYLVAGALGAVVGTKCAGWLAAGAWGRRALRGLAIVAGVMGLLGAATLTLMQPPWSSHCGFRYCGRALGPALSRSPFPVGTPSCRDLHMCANEYPFDQREGRILDHLIRTRGCEPP